MSKPVPYGSPWPGRSATAFHGGVMKLGKALATGIAEEQPQARDEEIERPELQGLQEIEEPALDEVPVAR
ncbi:uncharacterized protein SAZU_7448 [Streptomyces azureus]|uniref:Uncharacterized protein n=1 Tax=Streptomyces azureus TaxID=146537 RepID=A0A0K8PXS1_STRAJ|nr:uncharacterized protein SAZU_7448 [Streptomyces azureus]